MDVKNTHSITKTEISVFGRQALDAERRRSPSLAGKVLIVVFKVEVLKILKLTMTTNDVKYFVHCSKNRN